MFADRAKILIASGKGGDGHVSFRREKFVPNGGPDGGDGGKGGDVILEVDDGINTLYHFRHKHKFVAGNGEEGGKRRCHGKNGQDIVLKVPAGTLVRSAETGQVMADMSGKNRRMVLLRGGEGGLGNMHFATSTMQAPKFAKPGQEAISIEVILELKVIADVGLIGFPNVGKSTFLSRVTNAQPKIANYHFTTLNPNLGVVDLDGGGGFVIADIPGLIEGASEGLGLGHQFLRHIERTKLMIHIVDAASVEGRDPIEDIRAINHELESYNPKLLEKPQLIAANKLDVCPDGGEEILSRLREAFSQEGTEVFGISAATGKGVRELLYRVAELLSALPRDPITYEVEFDPNEMVRPEEAYTVEVNSDGEYVVEGPKIDKMLGYTNLESERGFVFFQQFLKKEGILRDLEAKGIQEGDTVRMYGLTFAYYKE